MRSHLRKLFDWAAGLFRATGKATTTRPAVRLETLEDRLALSTFAGAMPAGCTCPMCHGGGQVAVSDQFQFTNGTTSTSGAAKWSQPGGRGSPITITYSYSNLLDGGLGGGLDASVIRSAIEEALGRWAAVAPIRFVEVNDAGPRPIPNQGDYSAAGSPMLRFGHVPIDGRSGTLAYAYYPGTTGLAGDLFFDRGESWSNTPLRGTDLIEVAVHEIGHTLGIAHEPMPSSGGNNAIMNPFYGARYRGPGTSFLFADDINGITTLYGAGVGSVTTIGGGMPTPAGQNGFLRQGSVLLVSGTEQNDTFSFNAATGVAVLNGVTYTGGLNGITRIVFNGGQGTNSATVTGGSRSEAYNLYAGGGTVNGGTAFVEMLNVTNVTANGGSGDTLTFQGTRFDEALTVTSATARMTSGPHTLVGNGFSTVTANGNGGVDTAIFTGTSGSESVAFSFQGARMSGNGFVWTANGFPTITANGNGGSDTATFTASAGDDSFSASATQSVMFGARYTNTALGFSRVDAFNGGGNGLATLTGTGAGDVFTTAPGSATMNAGGVVVTVAAYRTYNLDGAAGSDTLTLRGDTSGNRLAADGTGGTLFTPTYRINYTGFETVNAQASTSLTDMLFIGNISYTLNRSGTFLPWR